MFEASWINNSEVYGVQKKLRNILYITDDLWNRVPVEQEGKNCFARKRHKYIETMLKKLIERPKVSKWQDRASFKRRETHTSTWFIGSIPRQKQSAWCLKMSTEQANSHGTKFQKFGYQEPRFIIIYPGVPLHHTNANHTLERLSKFP